MKSVCVEAYSTGKTLHSHIQKNDVRKKEWYVLFILNSFIVESSDSEMSAAEDTTEQNANRQNEDAGGDPFWILDLNPDMQS